MLTTAQADYFTPSGLAVLRGFAADRAAARRAEAGPAIPYAYAATGAATGDGTGDGTGVRGAREGW